MNVHSLSNPTLILGSAGCRVAHASRVLVLASRQNELLHGNPVSRSSQVSRVNGRNTGLRPLGRKDLMSAFSSGDLAHKIIQGLHRPRVIARTLGVPAKKNLRGPPLPSSRWRDANASTRDARATRHPALATSGLSVGRCALSVGRLPGEAATMQRAN
jgi:hypothetical protein